MKYEEAACLGMETEIFFTFEDALPQFDIESVTTVRKICFKCPIWRDCLIQGFRQEKYGIWGGITEVERQHIRNGRGMSQRLRRDCSQMGVAAEEVYGALKEAQRQAREANDV